MSGDKLLFLDVDGVLNTTGENFNKALDKGALEQLQRIVDKTGCKIVVSSQWRKTPAAMESLLPQLPKGAYVGKTPIRAYMERSKEIRDFIFSYEGKISTFAIIDDTPQIIDVSLKDFFVQTDPKKGITKTVANEVIKILNK